jgi:hypothetical protein
MQIEIGWRLGVDLVEKTNEFLVSMTRHTVADYFAIEHAQRGEQCGGAVAFVVVRHGPAAPLFDRQSWLGAIECLDLAFLVDAQDQGLVWRLEIKADHIVELFDKAFVAAELESLGQMRLQPVSIPNPLNRQLWRERFLALRLEGLKKRRPAARPYPESPGPWPW